MRTFLVITTAEYENYGEPFCKQVDVEDVRELEQWGWPVDEDYRLLNTDKETTIPQMQVGDCIESNEFYGKDATLYRIR